MTGPQLLEGVAEKEGGDFFQGAGGLCKKEGAGVFEEGVDTPMHSMRLVQNLRRNLSFVSKMTRIW